MLRQPNGTVFSTELFFAPDLPSGAITYTLKDGGGTTLLSTGASAPVGAISFVLTIPGTLQTVATGKLFETRRLSWSYPTINGLIQGAVAYRVDADLPFTVSADGVRTKLGVTDSELLDENIDLLAGYIHFVEPLLARDRLASFAGAGDVNELAVMDGIEAMTALLQLPILSAKVAKAQSDGANTLERNPTDWVDVRLRLEFAVAKGREMVDVPVVKTGPPGFFFGFSDRKDPVTGR